jgi:peptidoglycan/xylan/chitin deacetylase (PgdA/CDA1 family)
MSRHRDKLMKAGLSAMHLSGVDRLLAPLTRGSGVVFTLHHVQPGPRHAFDPNGILKVTPEFLEAVVQLVQERGFDVLSLDQMHARLTAGDCGRPFACFTFDDGYKDNRRYAYPVFCRHGLPFAIYVATDFADGRGELWWLALEKVIAAAEAIELPMDGIRRNFSCHSPEHKRAAFDTIYWWLRGIPEIEARRTVADLADKYRVDVSGLCRELVMDWDELRELARDPLVTIGAHTLGHYALARMPLEAARREIEASVRRIEAELGQPCRHFSFPYGDEASAGEREFELARALGLATAVTTRKSLIHRSHRGALSGLPRVSLNGEYQHLRYVKVMLSGAPFAFWNAARKAVPAWSTTASANGY